MTRTMTRRGLMAALGLALPGAALAQGEGPVVRMAPPALRHERIPPRPRAGLVWQPGYWRWDGRRHIWIAGRWAAPPRARARWVEGHWARRGPGWVWTPGHWR